MKKVIYVHYQRELRDGSNVHTTEFENSFSKICQSRDIAFEVVCPPVIDKPPRDHSSWLPVKRLLALFFVHDLKFLLEQYLQKRKEIKMLREKRPDIVLTRYNDVTTSIIYACRKLNIPVVLEFNSPGREGVDPYLYHVPGLMDRYTNQFAFNLASGAFAVSQVLVDELEPGQQTDKPRASIPNGVSLQRFDPQHQSEDIRAKLGIGADKQVVGFVGSFAPWHGVEQLVESMFDLLERNPNTHLLLVGQPKPESEQLLAICRQPPLRDAVTIAGFVPNENIPAYIAAMDITVLPNTAYYCSPLKLFEYMAMETAVVSVDTGPVREMLQDGEEGLLFTQGDFQQMAQLIGNLTLDQARCRALGKAARLRMQTDFTWDHNAEKVFDLLQSVHTKHCSDL